MVMAKTDENIRKYRGRLSKMKPYRKQSDISRFMLMLKCIDGLD
jgi:hypothetical protein